MIECYGKREKKLEQDMDPESSEWWKGVGFKKGFSIGLVGKVAFEQSLAKLMSGESVQVEETASAKALGGCMPGGGQHGGGK